MSFRPALLCCAVLLGITTSLSRAQLVHLQFHAGGVLNLHADTAGIPWDHAGGSLSTIDVFYNPFGAVRDWSQEEEIYRFPNAADAYWQLTFDLDYDLGTIVVTRPLPWVRAGGQSFVIQYADQPPGQRTEEFQMYLSFADTFQPFGKWPSEPLPPLSDGGGDEMVNSYFLSAGRSFFDIPHLNDGGGYGHVGGGTISPIISAVPEPATYGAAAVLLLVLGVIAHRRRSVRHHEACPL
ncbi:hypothetical protein [Opitutus terrae]|uniref:PEP-CTERM protein-sorting domain-containing protein n=1 Tax=Opitutus terrae (strain DSM 11246 / JCM 15787 / PB90-1) TaxID=452637 RepID=B1ZPP4_OPITP|nr:hypothetical protein [Opitutus terrae]ACB75497.1 hypothetical protein Oter_2214 [Opitutus terrae PB90-1]